MGYTLGTFTSPGLWTQANPENAPQATTARLARPLCGAVVVRAQREDSMAAETDMGALLKARRLELGLSQRQLAERVGVSHHQIQRYESGANGFGARLPRLAAALDVPPVFFLEDDDETVRLAVRPSAAGAGRK